MFIWLVTYTHMVMLQKHMVHYQFWFRVYMYSGPLFFILRLKLTVKFSLGIHKQVSYCIILLKIVHNIMIKFSFKIMFSETYILFYIMKPFKYKTLKDFYHYIFPQTLFQTYHLRSALSDECKWKKSRSVIA